MQKELRRSNVTRIIILAMLFLLCIALLGLGLGNKTAFAAGEEPFDSRARIGFKPNANEFFIEKTNGDVSVRVYVSQVQTVAIPFTLTETRFGGGAKLFVFANGYTLPAGSSYVDVSFNQIAQAESGSGVRLSDIYIHCNTPTVTVGNVEYYGEDEPYDDDFLAVVLDIGGNTELVIEGLPHLSYETDGHISSSFARSGSVSSGAEVYYRIKDYNPNNTKELVFDNYNSVLSFEANERNKTLKLEFFDNDRLNLREAYKLEIYSFQGISRIFDLSQRRYLEENEDAVLDFAIMDDELFSGKFIARAHYYQPGDTNPTYQISEGSPIIHNVIFDGLRNNPLPSFRLYYTVDVASTAIYGDDYVIGGYSQHLNLGFIEVPAGGEQYLGNIEINTIDDRLLNGTRTVYLKFFVSGRNDILLQPLDTITFEIIDNERLPDNNTVSWASIGSLNGCGWYEDNILRINNNFYDWDGGYIIGIDTNYHGTAPLNIPVRFEDITAKNGIDYVQESMYALLQYRPDIGTNKYGIDLNLINDFYFAGTRRLEVTILEEGLTQGLTIAGERELFIDLVGRIENDYNYIENTQSEINSIFSVGKNQSLTFKVKRVETEAFSTYLDISRNEQGFFIEGTHILAGIFPYEVVWAENEKEKTITLEFLQGWDDTNSASGLITCLDSNMQLFNDTYGVNHYTSVPITLYQSNSSALYYFQGNPMVTGLTREYKYSSGELLIEVKRNLLSAQSFNSSVDYNLTFDYDMTKTWQIITSQHAAEIGTHINALSGTLYFQGDETTKYIRVTVPDIINMPYGSKFVNIYLHNPSEKTYILRNWDWDGKFDTAKIKITNDITPVLEYSDLTTSTIEEGGYETTVINALEYERKEYDSFRLELIPYETDETPYHTKLYYSMEMYLYSGYDLSAAGIEVFVNGLKVDCIQTVPYIYNYSDGGGSHSITYSYAYVVNVLVNKENPFVSFTLKYSEIADKGLEFLTTSLLIKTHNPYFMNGWETYEKQLILKACEEDAEIDIEMRSSSVVSGGETNVQAGDIVYLTLTRRSTDPGASTMFFRSIAYGVKSFAASPDANYYFEPLNAFVIFEPYERSKTVAFITRDNRPQGIGWDSVASAALIKLYNYYNTSEILDELIVNVREDWPVTLINAEALLLNNYVNVQKRSGEPNDTITMKFVFDKAYDTDIEFSISGLDERIGNLTLTLLSGETEIIHNFTFNDSNFHVSSEIIFLEFEGIINTFFAGAEFNLTVPEGLRVVVSSGHISSQKFYSGVPSALNIDEDDKGYISLDIIANRSIYPSTWKDVIAYVSLGGTAIYGVDYFIRYDGKGGENIFDLSTGIVVIWQLHEKSTLKIYPIDNTIIDGEKTIILTVLDYHFGYVAYPETFVFTINDNEYFGDIYINKSQAMSLGGKTTVTLFRENYTLSNLTLSYEIESIHGIYGVDYVFSRMNAPNLAISGALTFYGASSSIVLYVNPLTEIGNTANFYFRISSEGDDYFSIKISEVFVSLRSIYDGGEFVARTVKTDSELNKWPGNYGDYLLDYTKYYSSYSAGAKVKVTSINFTGAMEDIYLDFNPNGLTYISASGRNGAYSVPSGISLNHWYDINGDGIKELIFVANLDTCFGGMAELNILELCGVYALDLVSGEYTLIFALDPNMVSRHLDIYINDLKGDGFPDAVVLSTPWADSLLRRNGGNILYIIDNTNGVFSVENVYDGNAVINGTNMTLYSVFVSGRYKGYDRTFIEVSYYSRTVGVRTAAYGAVIELSAGENARFIYCEGANSGIEGSNFVLTVHNVTGFAGTATMVFNSDDAVYGRDYMPESLTITFAEGEFVRNITLVTFNNNIPTDNRSHSSIV